MGQAQVIQFTTRLESIECYKCGVTFAMPSDMLQNARNKGNEVTFYCPNGHGQGFTESEVTRLQRQVALKDAEIKRNLERIDFEQRLKDEARATADRIGRRLSAQRGVATRMRKRIASGVCPCCNRTFVKLGAHMKTKHPEFAASEPSEQDQA
jgi:hypothetical protein